MVTLRVAPRTGAALHPPPSKSDAQRRLVLAHIDCQGLGAPEPGEADDVTHLRVGLQSLGGRIDCGDGGTPLRFLLAQAALHDVRSLLCGSPRLGQRPIKPLCDALRATLGARISSGWPLEVHGADRPAATAWFRVDAQASSQFESALWLAAAALVRRERRPWRVTAMGPGASPGYRDLTLDWLRRAGYGIDGDAVTGCVPTALPPVPPDWSGAAALAPVAWAFGLPITVDAEAQHPDRALLGVLADAGMDVRLAGALTLSGAPRRGFRHSAAVAPDLVPVLAAWATALPGPSEFRDLDVLRSKESDRLSAIADIARAAGATVHGDATCLRITPGRPTGPLRLAVRGDHRLLFAAVALGAVHRQDVDVDEVDVQRKSFPTFLDQVAPLPTPW